MRSYFHSVLVLAAILAITATVTAQKPPEVGPAKSYPANEIHPDEKVAIAADPFDSVDKSGFMKLAYLQYGFLPIRLIVTNDGDQPISLVQMKVQLITPDRQKLDPSTKDDISRSIVRTHRLSEEGSKRLPIPVPMKKTKQKEVKELDADWDTLPFRAVAVEPHSTQAGFLFFDVGDARLHMQEAKIFVTGVKNGGGSELFYFEIPLEKYFSPGATQ